jgi:hypothetical protein
MAKTLAEITKIDPSFNKDNFLHECEYEIIPTVLQVSAYNILPFTTIEVCITLTS